MIMFEEIFNNYQMGFLTARETSAKLLDAGFPESMIGVLNERFRENMQRILVERRSFEPCVNEVREILNVRHYDYSISEDRFTKDGILEQKFMVTLYASWTDARKVFEFDNYCAADNTKQIESLRKWVEEN